ncbi:MAG TPA: carboxypeptidase regulatory-like domain-containing protein [Anaerolineae bacterium]|nr:carboxypeptidase regulatory-like domain-containing protein [Anaerolineae bacterium]
MRRRLRWILAALLGLLILGLAWFSVSSDAKVTALRNVAHYQVVKTLGGPEVRADEPPGSITGAVRDADGRPVPGAVVLVASPLGDTYTAETSADGRYRIAGVLPGRYVPVAGKRGYGDALEQTCLAGLCFKHSVSVRSDREKQDVDLTLTPADSPAIYLDDSLIVSPTVEVEVGAPFPNKALRTSLGFERAGLWVNDCHLYEPVEGEGPFPVLILVLPGPVHTWEIIPVPFAAEGFSVLACYPLRGIDLDNDAADLLTALEYLKQGRIASRADVDRLVLVGASFTSLHAFRLLGLTDEMDVTLILGGMADGFSFRYDVEMGTAQTRPPFDQVLMALGFPNSSPELYFKYSVLYHLEGLPPICLLHGIDDELSPYSQSVQLATELERQGMPYEFYAYEGLSHYFSTSAESATTQQMFQDSLDCLRRLLDGE